MKLFRLRWVLFLTLALTVLATDDSLAAKRKKRTVRAKPAPAAPATRPMVLPFIQNDYAKALAEARARKVPIFVESWAPW